MTSRARTSSPTRSPTWSRRPPARPWARRRRRTRTAGACCAPRSASATRTSTTANFEGGAHVESVPDRGRLRGAAPRAVAAQRRGLQERGRDAGAQARRRPPGRPPPTKTTASATSRRRRPRRSRFRSPPARPIRRCCARPCAGCRWCSRRSPRSTDRTSPERPRSCAAGWRPAKGRGSTTTSAPSASTSSPTRRPTTA